MKNNFIKKIGILTLGLIVSIGTVVMAESKFKLKKFSMKLGETQALSTVMDTKNFDSTKLSSSNPSVISIENGEIKAKATGISTLTYTYNDPEGNEKESYCHIEVKKGESTYFPVNGNDKAKIMVTLNYGEYTTTVESSLGAIFDFPEVTKEGYILEGWYKDSNFLNKVPERERLAKDITYYAKWVKADELKKPEVSQSVFYDDINNHWAKNYIETVSYRGLFNGVSERMFGPDKTMTRAMVITVIGRLEGVENKGRTTEFVDVPKGAYYEEYLAWGIENKIVSGVTDKEFAPNREITREEMAVMMANYVKFKKYKYEMNELYFSDVDAISDWAVESVKILNDLKIMQGNKNGTYLPKKVATRAEIATVFYNYLNFINK